MAQLARGRFGDASLAGARAVDRLRAGQPAVSRQRAAGRGGDTAAGAAANGARLLSAGGAGPDEPGRPVLRMGVRRAASIYLAGSGAGVHAPRDSAAGEVGARGI